MSHCGRAEDAAFTPLEEGELTSSSSGGGAPQSRTGFAESGAILRRRNAAQTRQPLSVMLHVTAPPMGEEILQQFRQIKLRANGADSVSTHHLLTDLRAAIARIEAGGAALERGPAGRRAALGADATQLDAALGGGLSRGALHEIIPKGAPDSATAAGFALALALRFAAAGDTRRALVWITEDFAATEGGALYGPGLAAFGLDPARLILVHAAQGAQALWAMEEALKCRALAAVVGELWDARAYDLTASRRLALAARASGTPGILLPARAPPASAAATRFAAAADVPSPRHAVRGKPLPGPPAFDIRLLRARGALQLDPDRHFSLVFDPAEGCFRDRDPAPQPHLGAVPADIADRPHPPPAPPGARQLRRA